jgi:hypothetical protein
MYCARVRAIDINVGFIVRDDRPWADRASLWALIRLFSTPLSTDGSGVADGVGVAVGVPGVGDGEGVDVTVGLDAVVAVAGTLDSRGAGVAVIRIKVDARSGVEATAGRGVGVTGMAATCRPTTGTGVSVAIVTLDVSARGVTPVEDESPFAPCVHAAAPTSTAGARSSMNAAEPPRRRRREGRRRPEPAEGGCGSAA